MNRIIFLDIDGVLNSNFWNDIHQREISDGTLIDVEKVKLLSMLVKRTNAKIILHSGWKYWFDQDLKPLRLEAENLIMLFKKEELLLEGITPDHSTEEIRRNKKFSLVKASEILAWLAEHKDVDNWVVIDDLDLHSKEIEMHQVKTDPNLGLTIDDVHKAEKMLLAQSQTIKNFWSIKVKMKVEYGTKEDISSWMKLVNSVSWNFPGLETEEQLKEHENTVLRFMSERRALCVKEENAVVGVLLFSKKHNMICCLAVSPDFRRQGIATALLSKAIEILDRTRNINVSTFRENDPKGIAPRRLYKSFGFVEGELIEEYGYPNQQFVLLAK